MSTKIAANSRREAQAPAGRILVVDDRPESRESIADVLRQADHLVDCVSSGAEALTCLEERSYDVVLTDLQMPGMSGLEFMRELDRRKAGVQVAMITAYATVASAVEAMRYGAFDYIEKPFDADKLEGLVARAIQRGRALDQGPALSGGTHTGAGHDGELPVMIGSSAAMKALRERIRQIAPTPETVLITGESGTGKELVARAVHAASDRSSAPLVSLNCPVLSPHLLESELFGHERGAFTGADASRTGRFELASGGTILLDEVTEIDLALQAKLLRVLQERSFERVGSSHTLEVDVRVLATSNRDLTAEVARGRLREDLYYRLAVLPIRVPPLRERRKDVPELLAHFFNRAAQRLHREPCLLEPSAYTLLTEYHWPGNVRELENLVTRASVLNSGRPIGADELRPWLIDPAGKEPETQDSKLVGLSVQEMERRLIESTLEHFNGHRARTAKALGIGIRTLSGKLKGYGYAPRARVVAKAG